MKIAVIGGGISGLTTAFYLNFFGNSDGDKYDITVFEKEKELGGKMRTKNIKGFLVEEGTNGFLSNRPDTLELLKYAGIENLLLKSNDNAKVRFIYKDKLYKMQRVQKISF